MAKGAEAWECSNASEGETSHGDKHVAQGALLPEYIVVNISGTKPVEPTVEGRWARLCAMGEEGWEVVQTAVRVGVKVLSSVVGRVKGGVVRMSRSALCRREMEGDLQHALAALAGYRTGRASN